MRCYLGLDCGGTNLKAALFTVDGRQLCAASEATEALCGQSGFAEIDMEELWQRAARVVRTLLARREAAGAEVAGLGVCGHGKGLYLWGRDGRPVRRGILSADSRALRYELDWRADGTEDKAFALSCQHLMACQPVCLLAWLRDHEPGALERTQWVFECKDYLRFRLTGQARAERSDYSGTGLMNLRTGRFDAALTALFGLSAVDGALPPLCDSCEIAGAVTPEAAALTGLRPGTPVVGGMFDIDACALAVGVTDARHVCMIAGTWSINEYPRPEPVLDGTAQMNSLFCLPGRYLVEESSPTSAGNSEWFLRQLLPELAEAAGARGESVYNVMNAWAADFAPGDFVPLYLPFLNGGNADPRARACFLGISAGHSRRHLLRGVYEGVCFSHRWHLERLLATRRDAPETIRLTGGAARSPVWVQMFADVMGLPVETSDAEETGALGCAVAVAAALGDYASPEAAAAAMGRLAPAVEPRPEAMAAYERKYALYRKALESLSAFWPDMQASMEAST